MHIYFLKLSIDLKEYEQQTNKNWTFLGQKIGSGNHFIKKINIMPKL